MDKPSLYSKYVHERLGKQVLEVEHGFATYIFMDDQKAVYIEDIYVDPDFRKSGIASEMANQITLIAIEKGYKKIIGTVVPSTNGSTDSLKTMLAYGFRLDSTTNNLILLTKEI